MLSKLRKMRWHSAAPALVLGAMLGWTAAASAEPECPQAKCANGKCAATECATSKCAASKCTTSECTASKSATSKCSAAKSSVATCANGTCSKGQCPAGSQEQIVALPFVHDFLTGLTACEGTCETSACKISKCEGAACDKQCGSQLTGTPAVLDFRFGPFHGLLADHWTAVCPNSECTTTSTEVCESKLTACEGTQPFAVSEVALSACETDCCASQCASQCATEAVAADGTCCSSKSNQVKECPVGGSDLLTVLHNFIRERDELKQALFEAHLANARLESELSWHAEREQMREEIRQARLESQKLQAQIDSLEEVQTLHMQCLEMTLENERLKAELRLSQRSDDDLPPAPRAVRVQR